MSADASFVVAVLVATGVDTALTGIRPIPIREAVRRAAAFMASPSYRGEAVQVVNVKTGEAANVQLLLDRRVALVTSASKGCGKK